MYDPIAMTDDGWILWVTLAMVVWGIIWVFAYIHDWYEMRKISKRFMAMLTGKRK